MGIRKDGGIYTPNAKMIKGKKFDLNVDGSAAKKGGYTGRLKKNASYEEESRNTVRIYEDDDENEEQDNDEEDEEEEEND